MWLFDCIGIFEYVFIVFEGKIGRKVKIWFVDFIVVKKFDVFKLGIVDGKVRLDYYELEDLISRLFF